MADKKQIKECISSIIEKSRKEVQKNISVYTLNSSNGKIKIYHPNKNENDISFQITEYHKKVTVYSGTFNGLREVKNIFDYGTVRRVSFQARNFDAKPELNKRFMDLLKSYAGSK